MENEKETRYNYFIYVTNLVNPFSRLHAFIFQHLLRKDAPCGRSFPAPLAVSSLHLLLHVHHPVVGLRQEPLVLAPLLVPGGLEPGLEILQLDLLELSLLLQLNWASRGKD